jgi:hypothetical protein
LKQVREVGARLILVIKKLRISLSQAAAELAAQGVFIGTSSWKYEGWFGHCGEFTV